MEEQNNAGITGIKGALYRIGLITASALLALGVYLGIASTEKFHQKTVANGIHYFAPEKGFHINFPDSPNKESSELNFSQLKQPLHYNEYKSCPGSKLCFAVGFVDFPSKWKFAGARKLLQGALTVLTQKEPDTQLVSQEMTSHNDYPAINFHLKKGEKEVEGRIVLIGSTFYNLSVTYALADASPVESQQFLDSFYTS